MRKNIQEHLKYYVMQTQILLLKQLNYIVYIVRKKYLETIYIFRERQSRRTI